MVISLDIQPTGWFETILSVSEKWFQLRKKWISLEYSWIQHVFKQFYMIWRTWVVLKNGVLIRMCVSLNDENCWKNLFVLWRATQCQAKPRFKGLKPNNKPLENQTGKVLENDHGNGVYHVGVYPKSHDIVGAMHHIQVPFPLYSHMCLMVPCLLLFLFFFLYFSFETHLLIHVCSLSFCRTQYIHIYMHIRYHMSCWLNIVFYWQISQLPYHIPFYRLDKTVLPTRWYRFVRKIGYAQMFYFYQFYPLFQHLYSNFGRHTPCSVKPISIIHWLNPCVWLSHLFDG